MVLFLLDSILSIHCWIGDADMDKKKYLDSLTETYKMEGSKYIARKRDLIINIFSEYINKGNALELGCADGYESKLISELVSHLDIIDGSEIFINQCKSSGLKNVNIIHTLFEEYTLPVNHVKYDYVFASYVMEHVDNPVDIYKMIKRILKPDGLLFVTVPNARAFSRQWAVSMGMLGALKELTQNDLDHGHKRVYDWLDFEKELKENGFDILKQGGTFFKILCDFQMDELIESGMFEEIHFEGLANLGRAYPDFCDSIYAVCKQQNK